MGKQANTRIQIKLLDRYAQWGKQVSIM